MKPIACCLCLFIGFSLHAQPSKKSVVIGSLVSKPNAVLILNPEQNDQGFLLPQLSTHDRLAITPISPDEDGLIVFDQTEKSFYYWKNNQWVNGLGNEHLLSFNPTTLQLSNQSSHVDLAALKEIPDVAGMGNRLLFTDGTSLYWKSVNDFGDIASVVSGIGLSGGSLAGDATLNVALDNISLAVNATNQLTIADQGVTLPKILPGPVNTVLTTEATGAVVWAPPTIWPDAQDLSISGNVLSLSNDTSPVDLSALSLGGTNITDGTIATVDIADGAITLPKFLPGGNNTVLTTDGTGSVVWALPTLSPDAQDLSVSGNVLALSNDTTPVDLSSITAMGLVSGPINNLIIENNTISTNHVQNGAVSITKLGTTGLADAGKVFTTDALGAPQLEAKSNIMNGIVAEGDLGGTYPAPSVIKLQGNAVATGILRPGDTGKILVWNGTQWVPQSVPAITPSSKYIMIDPADFINLRQGDKKDKDNMVIFEDNSTYITVYKRNEGAYLIAPLHLSHGAAIEQVTLYYMDRDVNNLNFALYRKTTTGANENVTMMWTSTGNSGTIQSSMHTPIVGRETVDNDTYSYRLIVRLDPSNDTVDSNDANHRVYSVKVRYMN